MVFDSTKNAANGRDWNWNRTRMRYGDADGKFGLLLQFFVEIFDARFGLIAARLERFFGAFISCKGLGDNFFDGFFDLVLFALFLRATTLGGEHNDAD